MAFDPITWAVGFVLTNAAKKGLDSFFPQELRKKLETGIVRWAGDLPETAFVYPDTLFPAASKIEKNQDAFPALNRIQQQLLALTIPTEQEWHDCFMELWRSIRKEQGENAQPFFLLSEEVARKHLHSLAAAIHKICCADEKTVLPHVVTKLESLEGKLEQLLQFQALKGIPTDWTPDEHLKDFVMSAVCEVAAHRGWENACLITVGRSDRVALFLKSGVTDRIAGLMDLDDNRLRIWAPLSRREMVTAISNACFRFPLFNGLEENWNAIVEFIGKISRMLYPNSIRNGTFGISARYDLKRIGVPVPIDYQVKEGDERVEMLQLAERQVPFLTFGPQELQGLIGIAEVDVGDQISTWLFREWGTPSAIRREN